MRATTTGGKIRRNPGCTGAARMRHSAPLRRMLPNSAAEPLACLRLGRGVEGEEFVPSSLRRLLGLSGRLAPGCADGVDGGGRADSGAGIGRAAGAI